MEEKVLKKRFFLHVLYNMIAFTIIFATFEIAMFFRMKQMTFQVTDQELFEFKDEILEVSNDFSPLYDILGIKKSELFDGDMEQYIEKNLKNPLVTFILRDKDGNILNKNILAQIEEYIPEIEFDNSKLDKVYKLKIDDRYNYRGLNFAINDFSNSNVEYVQLLINVDGEIYLIDKDKEIIAYAIVLGMVLAGIASFILSKKSLQPVRDILKRQTEFVQNVSHELRTPLTIIQAKQELLLQEPNAKIIDKSEEIMLTLSETKRLSKLIKDLMILVRGSKLSKVNLQIEDINIDEFIKTIVAPYMDIVNIQNKKIVLDLNFNKDIGIDTNKFHQLLVILLDNAIKYTEKGDEIKISTHLKDNKCILEVSDTGIGISDEGLNHVFDRFYREDRARSRENGGTGLGLSIALLIVEAHKGTIKVSHNTPKGTVFTVKFNR